MDTIQCHHCRRNCVPRLWHYSPFLAQFRYLRTQHSCPFCGNVMYETGGQFTPFGLFVLLFTAIVTVSIVVSIKFPQIEFGYLLGTLVIIAIGAVVIKAIYRFSQE